MQVDSSWTCVQTCIGGRGQMELQVYRKCTQVAIKAIWMLLRTLQFSTRGKQNNLHWLALGVPNGEKRTSICAQIWYRSKWTQVIARHGQTETQVVASGHKLEVYLPLLVSPFGQGFRCKRKVQAGNLGSSESLFPSVLLHDFWYYSWTPRKQTP